VTQLLLGSLAALVTACLTGLAILAVGEWGSLLALFLGPVVCVAGLFGGPVAAFALARHGKPAIRAVLARVRSCALELLVLSVPGAFFAFTFVAFGTMSLMGEQLTRGHVNEGWEPYVLPVLFVVFALRSILAWAEYFLFPATVVVAEPGKRLGAAWSESRLLERRRTIVFCAAATVGLGIVAAAIPDETSQKAAHGVLDPRGVALLRGMVAVAAAFASTFAGALLAAAAHGVSVEALDGSALDDQDRGP
jgi:hypothetical protein